MYLEMNSGTRVPGRATVDAFGLEKKFDVPSEGSYDARLSSTEDAVQDDQLSFAPEFSPGNELSESDTLFRQFGEPTTICILMATT
jgi:hypothetical protein